MTITLQDLQSAVGRFAQQRPADRIREAANGTEAGRLMLLWGLGEFCEPLQERGYVSVLDLNQLDEPALRELRMLTKPTDARRARALCSSLRADALALSAARDALYMPADCRDLADWLASVSCAGAAGALLAGGVHFDVLGELSYDDLRELGVAPVGLRRRLHSAIALFAAQRESARAQLDQGDVGAVEVSAVGGGGDMDQRLNSIKETISSLVPKMLGRR